MNWPRIAIGRLCGAVSAEDPRERQSFRYVDISSIERIQKGIVHVAEMEGRAAPSRARQAIRAGDVLVSTVRPNLNAVAIVPQQLDGEIASTGFCVLRPKQGELSERYLFYYCCTPAFIDALVAKVRGAQYPAISDSDIKAVELPFPPLTEQRRIVEILDHADRLRRLRAEADAKAERVLLALFIKMFGDPATNPLGWPTKLLGDLTERLTSGSRGWSKYTGRGPAYFLRTQDIDGGDIARDLLPVDPPHGAETERTRLAVGDVAITITGIVGKAAVFRGHDRPVYVSQHVALVRPKPYELCSEYLAQYANLPIGDVPVLARFQYGQTKPGLGFQELRTARILLPPLERQSAFTKHANAVRIYRRTRTTSSKTLAALWMNLLSRAFSGALTLSWRKAHMKELLREMEHQAKALAATAWPE